MVFYIDDDMQNEYKCGLGILRSTDRKPGKIRLQWVVIIRLESNSQSKVNDTMMLLREMQSKEQEINQTDYEFEQNVEVILLDQMIKSLLEEEIPSSRRNQILFSNLKERHEQLFQIYQNVQSSLIKIAEMRVELAKAQYEKALAELSLIKDVSTRCIS